MLYYCDRHFVYLYLIINFSVQIKDDVKVECINRHFYVQEKLSSIHRHLLLVLWYYSHRNETLNLHAILRIQFPERKRRLLRRFLLLGRRWLSAVWRFSSRFQADFSVQVAEPSKIKQLKHFFKRNLISYRIGTSLAAPSSLIPWKRNARGQLIQDALLE